MSKTNRLLGRLRTPMVAVVLSHLVACTTLTPKTERAPDSGSEWESAAISLRSEDWDAAETTLARLLQQDLQNGHLQFLHAYAVEQQGLQLDRARLDHARVGYENALRFAPGHSGAQLRLGFLALESGDEARAQEYFAVVASDQPGWWDAWYGLGVASYLRRDLAMLALAAERCLLLKPDSSDALRLTSLARAVQKDPSATSLVQRAIQGEPDPYRGRYLQRRVAELLSAEVADTSEGFISDTLVDPVVPAPEASAPPSQVMVDVTILLSSALKTSSRGVNLFEGLRLLYGYTNSLSSLRNTGFGRENTRSVISQISTPQLDYSLDLFNDAGQHYNVVARPSITAYLGRESQFFAGRTLNVEVSGINLGQLLPIDVGVQLRVTPEAISADRLTFTVNAERSFLTQEQVGTFERSLTTFRQTVGATAEVQFGETLVMSALSEQVSDSVNSQVPVAGRIPVVKWFSRRAVDSERQESLLILVTPRIPMSFAGETSRQERAGTVQKLLESWQQSIDPGSNVEAILKRVQNMRWLRAPKVGDLRSRPLKNSSVVMETVEESLLLGKR